MNVLSFLLGLYLETGWPDPMVSLCFIILGLSDHVPWFRHHFVLRPPRMRVLVPTNTCYPPTLASSSPWA